VRPGALTEVRELAKTSGMVILAGGGVIRSLENWDTMLLPSRVRKHQTYYDRAHYFLMRFDSNSTTQKGLRDVLGLDPRMVKFSVVKVGSKLEEVARGT
jgi:small subunit ribosomal protein S6